jgi:para-nitrobenzyl esterase
MRLSRELGLVAFLLLAVHSQAQAPGRELVGTRWQLVGLQTGDRRTFTPDDKTKYTFAFGTGGAFSARIDCNRGSGTWNSSGPQLLEIAPFAITRAMCPPGSLFDEIVKRIADVRTYAAKDGRLYLYLVTDGGTLELEAIAGAPQR